MKRRMRLGRTGVPAWGVTSFIGLRFPGHPGVACLLVLAFGLLSEAASQDRPLFGALEYYPGDYARGVALADLNGDLALDAVVGLDASTSIAVFLNGGTGLFSDPVFYRAGDSPRAVAAGDVNGDGRQDVVAANFRAGTFTVLLNLGAGILQDAAGGARSYTTTTTPTGVAIGHLNGDDDLDIVTTALTLGNVTIHLNNGDGTFRAPASLPAGGLNVVIGDVDGDLDNDLVTDSGAVLLNRGDGTFPAPVDYHAGELGLGVALEDLDDDVDLDMLIGSGTSTLTVLFNDGDGVYGSPEVYAVDFGPFSVALGDLNGDDLPDIAAANRESSTVSLLFNEGDGSFGLPEFYLVDPDPFRIALGDIDRDGAQDVVVSSSITGTILSRLAVLLNDGEGTLTGEVRIPAAERPTSVLARDWDRDGDMDLVASSAERGISLLENQGGLSFRENVLVARSAGSFGPNAVEVGDIDGDEDDDIVTANWRFASFSVFHGNGEGEFSPERVYSTLGAGFGRVPDLALADVDADDDHDVVLIGTGSFPEDPGSVIVYRNPGSGVFSTGVPHSVPDGPNSLAVEDIDRDGDPDLVVVSGTFREGEGHVGALTRLLNDGTGAFGSPLESASGEFPVSLALTDLNGDSYVDAIVLDQDRRELVVKFNDRLGAFPAAVAYPCEERAGSIAVGDPDRDGDSDILVTNLDIPEETVRLFLNDGDGNLIREGNYRVGASLTDAPNPSHPAAFADVDGDGDQDIIAVNRGSDDLSLLLNRSIEPEAVEWDAAAGETVTTDTESDGTAPDDPVETWVTSPAAGLVTIMEGPVTTGAPRGFHIFGHQVDISAPPASADEPIVIVFRLDASILPPDATETTVQILKDGVPVANCSTAETHAIPDPCISDRRRLADDDLEFTMLTSSASAWNFALFEPDWDVELELGIEGPFGRDLLRLLIPDWKIDLLLGHLLDLDQDGREEMNASMSSIQGHVFSQSLGLLTLRFFNPSPANANVRFEEIAGQLPHVFEMPPFWPNGGSMVRLEAPLEFDLPDPNLFVRTERPVVLEAAVRAWPPGEGQAFKLVNGPLQVLDLNNTAAFKLVSFSIRTVIAGQIEIKPGSEGHPFVALRSRGAIPVAVISTPGFDAPASLDWSSLRFGRTGEEASLALRGKSREPQCSVTDVNQDGLDDLLCLFETRMTRFLPGDVEGILTARTVGGNLFKAGDFFRSR